MRQLCECGNCTRCKHREYMRKWNAAHPEQVLFHRLNNSEKYRHTPEYKAKKREEYLRNRDKYIARAAAYQKANKDAVNEKNRRWKKENSRQVLDSQIVRRQKLRSEGRMDAIDRRHDLQKLYGVTPQWYEAKWKEQGERCAICGAKTSGAKGRRPHVDHDHETNQNRGILCHSCNVCLHILERIPDWPEKARAYLNAYRNTGMGERALHRSGGAEPVRPA